MYAACDHDGSQAFWAIQNGDAAQISLQCNQRRRLLEARECFCLRIFLLSPIFLCRKIKDGGSNNTNTVNKVWPTQNTPALQAKRRSDVASAKFVANWTESATSL